MALGANTLRDSLMDDNNDYLFESTGFLPAHAVGHKDDILQDRFGTEHGDSNSSTKTAPHTTTHYNHTYIPDNPEQNERNTTPTDSNDEFPSFSDDEES